MSLHSALREQYTYCLFEIDSRDAIVFKSILGLLAGRTQASWLQVECGAADLLVVRAGSDGVMAARRHDNESAVVLSIGAIGAAGSAGLSLQSPLRAHEVVGRLDQAAAQIILNRARGTAPLDTAVIRLLRWPPVHILQRDPQYLRIATLLSARAMTVTEVAARCAVPEHICQSFFDAAIEAGIAVAESSPTTAVAPATRAPTGLFARIRAHFGLQGQRTAP